MKKTMVLLVAVLFAFVSFAGKKGGFKFGYAELNKVFQSYTDTQKVISYLKDKENAIKDQLKQEQDKIMKWRDSWANDKKLSKDEKKKKEDELYQRLMQLQQMRDSMYAQLDQMRRNYEKKLEDVIIKAAEELAKQKGLAAIFDRRVVVFGGIDVTDDLIKLLNSKYVGKVMK